MTAECEDKKFFFLLCRGKNPKGFLPETTVTVLEPGNQEKKQKFDEKEYELVFRDDYLYVDTQLEGMPKIPLDAWIPSPTYDVNVSVELPEVLYSEKEVFDSNDN